MKGVTIFENIIGILVALMILFQILPSAQTSRELNNPAYIIAFLIFLVAVFSVRGLQPLGRRGEWWVRRAVDE